MKKYLRTSEIIDGALDGNQIMMHLGKGKYFSLNPIGKRIWEMLEEPKSLDELIQALLLEYEVTETECRQDVSEFLDQAMLFDIIRTHEAD